MPKPLRVIIPLLLIAVAVTWFSLNRQNESPEGALVLSGNIEANTAQLSFQVAGLLVERSVDEGDAVVAGQVIARLDSRELTHNVALKQAQLAGAEALLAELESGTRPERINQAAAQVSQARARLNELEEGARGQEIAQAEATVVQARADLARTEAQLELSEAEYARAQELYGSGVYPAQQMDQAQAALKVAFRLRDAALGRVASTEEMLSLTREGPREEQLDQARGALNAAAAVYAEAANGPRPETIEQALAQVELAREALSLAETQLSFAQLSSPSTGVVLTKAAEPGEYVRPGTPVIGIANLTEVWLRAYLSERDLGKVSLGQRVEVTTDSFPEKTYVGTLSYISSEAEFTPKTIQTSEERVKLVYRVKITIPNQSGELKPGMPADAAISLASNEDG